jgi:hypothetical protein
MVTTKAENNNKSNCKIMHGLQATSNEMAGEFLNLAQFKIGDPILQHYYILIIKYVALVFKILCLYTSPD